MTISKELFLSILAMDSYNRNYGAGIDGLPVAQGKVGGASIWQDAEDLFGQPAAITTPGKTVYNGPAADTIIVGHSLGGGLAEVVSLISGTPGFGFDRMPTAAMGAMSR